MFIGRRPQCQWPSAADPGRRAGWMLPRTWLIRKSVQVDSQHWDEPHPGTELRQTTQLPVVQAERTHRAVSREIRLATATDALVRAVPEA
jgi:hypothetical protein